MTRPTDPRAILDALIAHVEHEGARAASDRVYCDLLALRDAMLAAAHRWVHGADERETVALRRALDAEEM